MQEEGVWSRAGVRRSRRGKAEGEELVIQRRFYRVPQLSTTAAVFGARPARRADGARRERAGGGGRLRVASRRPALPAQRRLTQPLTLAPRGDGEPGRWMPLRLVACGHNVHRCHIPSAPPPPSPAVRKLKKDCHFPNRRADRKEEESGGYPLLCITCLLLVEGAFVIFSR
ncbi:hypothetical protein SKAU_G00272620 [Synaphobranchus kaupii]|uniref:Uncharacterized protein n=1 Tax=Synaphobranchus kaupii TaxID=118154 RepID=A0A9Q1INQ3_SYNKA|nr:hypothetical protein SKAU_G00272620 [Synaphobranchus kaupii]